MERRDVIVLGGGPAGYSAAIRLSQLGKRVVLVEKEILGGTCLNRGCIPTMVRARAAELLEESRNARDFGITFAGTDLDYEKLGARRKMVSRIHVGGVKSLLEAQGIEVLYGQGRLASRTEVEVTDGAGEKSRLTAGSIIVATGTMAAPPRFAGDSGRTIDTQQLLEVPTLPSSIIIIGGGFLSLTFATIFSCLGAATTVIEESDVLLPEIDREITETLSRELKKNKIRVIRGARPMRIGAGPDNETEVEVETTEGIVRIGAARVVRTERLPNTDGLGLAEIGVALNERGGIKTNHLMETSVRSVFAAGDVTMNHLSTPAAYAQGLIAAENAAGNRISADQSAFPFWANTIPAVSGAGMTEEEAIARGYAVKIGRFPMAANGMATIMGRRTGMIKVIADARYGEILGVHMIGIRAPDLINEALVAMRNELTPREIGKVFHVHPSLFEALWDAMRSVDGESINSFSPNP